MRVPILTSDIDAAIARYEALTGEVVRERFELPNGRVQIAILGSLTIIAGTSPEIGVLREVRATLIVDSLAEFEAHLRAAGATMLQRPARTPAGTNMIVRDVDGTVLELVEPHPEERPHAAH